MAAETNIEAEPVCVEPTVVEGEEVPAEPTGQSYSSMVNQEYLAIMLSM